MFLSRVKEWLFHLIYVKPKVTGWLAFLGSLALSLFFSLTSYQLRLSSERELVTGKLHEFEDLLASVLNDAVSAAETLGFIAQNQENVVEKFEGIASQILKSNSHVDVLQLLDSGTIVAVYPLAPNRAVIGYDILNDPNTKREAEEAIRRRSIYFSGPLTLKQGGTGIIGRLPLFDQDGSLRGMSAVIIRFDSLFRLAELNNGDSQVALQFSKVNPNTDILDNFLTEKEGYSGPKAELLLALGNWIISAQLKKSAALPGLIVHGLLSLFGSAAFGLLIWSFAGQPRLLQKRVAEQSRELLRANERFELASRATSDVLWDWDLVAETVYRSDRFSEVLGYSDKNITNQSGFWPSIIHPDDYPRIKNLLFQTLESKSHYWSGEFRVRKADGSYTYVIDKAFIVRDKKGKTIRMIGAFQDISVRKASEHELLKLNEKLSNANGELKAFASLASHDMREPLRMISSFMSLLERRYGSTLDDKANQYIAFAMDGAKRLSAMIADLLEYSKVGFDASRIEHIHTQLLVEEVLQLQSNLIRECDAQISVAELPDIEGVRISIQILFQNLISNALKYRHADRLPEVKISGRELEDSWEFSIIDNGIGIAAENIEEVFEMLKRLHSKEKYPGTGLGLAACRKIVSQHGGQIWAESKVGQGSNFSFTIKKHERTLH